MLASLPPLENLEHVRRVVRAELADCLQLDRASKHVSSCIKHIVGTANRDAPLLDPMAAGIDPRTERSFGSSSWSCLDVRQAAAVYLDERDEAWFMSASRAAATCADSTLVDELGLHRPADIVPWLQAYTGYYGDYWLPYDGGEGCRRPTLARAGEGGEDDPLWEFLRSRRPTNFGYYSQVSAGLIPRPTGVCARRLNRPVRRDALPGHVVDDDVHAHVRRLPFLDVLSVPGSYRLGPGRVWRVSGGLNPDSIYGRPFPSTRWDTWADTCTTEPGHSSTFTIEVVFMPAAMATRSIDFHVSYVANADFRGPEFRLIASETVRIISGRTSVRVAITIGPQPAGANRIVVGFNGYDAMGRPVDRLTGDIVGVRVVGVSVP